MNPPTADDHFRRAADAEARQEFETAISLYRAALALNPDFLEAHHNLGGMLRRLDQADAAIEHGLAAKQLSPDHATVRHSLALSLEANGELERAIEELRSAQTISPTSAEICNNLGRILCAAGYYEEAVTCLEDGLTEFTGDARLHTNLANALVLLGRPDDAIAHASKALAIDPGLGAAFNVRGAAHTVLGNGADAVEDLRAAIALAPDFAEAHENLALALLQAGQHTEGWREYEWRWQNPSNRLTKPTYDIPRWGGEDLNGRTLLLHDEQGLGDSIHFIRFAGLIPTGNGQIIVSCRRPLQRLFAELPWISAVCDQGDVPEGADCWLPIMSLPHVLGVDPEQFAGLVPYLLMAARDNDGKNGEKPFKVAINWAGSGKFPKSPFQQRDCPLSQFTRLNELANIELIPFQKGPQLDKVGDYPEIHTTPSQRSDFADDLVALGEIDLVITIDTAFAHLAAAADVPTWIALPYAADWRWGREGESTPWYPSVRLFRQPDPGNWGAVFERIAAQLNIVMAK